MKKKVLGLVGPTASGKTALSIRAAQALRGQIVCMDSMQIYRGMDIGTAKPTAAEQQAVPHHLLDIVSPFDTFTVSEYAAMAKEKLDALPCPVLVGGTGLYLSALETGMELGGIGSSEALRAKYHALAETEGNKSVHRVLEKCDPVTAARLHPNDLRRVIRAIEVYELTGTPLSAQNTAAPENCPWDLRLYAIDWPRETLYARVERRVDEMMRAGLMREVQALHDLGVPANAQSMQGLGYKELYEAIEGKTTLADAVSLIKLRTRHYAKRQLTWFRRDARVNWLNAEMTADEMLDKILTEYEN